jgi:hypothetical protein
MSPSNDRKFVFANRIKIVQTTYINRNRRLQFAEPAALIGGTGHNP